MFVINNEQTKAEFLKTSWINDYAKYKNISDTIAARAEFAQQTGEVPFDIRKDALDYVNDFASGMNAALSYIASNNNTVAGYVNARSDMVEMKMAPEDFEYGIVGNIATGAVTGLPNALDLPPLFGYIPAITKIVSNDPYTIVFFADDTSCRVDNDGSEPFNPVFGVCLAVLKKAIGNKHLSQLLNLVHDKVSLDSPAAPAPVSEAPAADAVETTSVADAAETTEATSKIDSTSDTKTAAPKRKTTKRACTHE